MVADCHRCRIGEYLTVAFRDPRIQVEIRRQISAISTREGRLVTERIVREMCSMGTSSTLEALVAPENYIRPVISMREFLEDPYFLGDMENLRPRLRADLIALFDEGQYVEAVVDGARVRRLPGRWPGRIKAFSAVFSRRGKYLESFTSGDWSGST